VNRHRAAAMVCSTAGALTLLASCTDIFHATDFTTACDQQLTAPGCLGTDADTLPDRQPLDAGDAESGDGVCVDDLATARDIAERTCANLGAYGGPLDSSGFGACMALALPAYDCRVDPARKPLGEKRAFYKCMRNAVTKDAINACINNNALPRACPVDSTVTTSECGTDSPDPPADQLAQASNRYACVGNQRAAAEPCIASGQRCYYQGTGLSRCGGIAGKSCSASGCRGSHLLQCVGGEDRGRDCALEGAGRCDTSAGVAFCVPLAPATAPGPSCDPTATPVCEGKVASACIGGVRVRVDCERLGLTCKIPITVQATTAPEALCSAKTACDEACAGDKLTYCLRGTPQTFDCTGRGFGACELSTASSLKPPRCKPRQ
jgi:hypothetical protein